MTTPPKAKQLATKQSAEKPVTKPIAKLSTPPSTDPAPDPVFIAWRDGAKISDLVKSHKLSRAEVRRRLLTAAGSKEQFRALRNQGAGGPMTKPATALKEKGR